MPIKRRYWTLSTDNSRTPIEVTEIEDFPMTQPQQQVQYIQIPPQGNGSIHPSTHSPIQTAYPQPVMVRPQQRSPIPFVAGAAGLFLCFYSWSASAQVSSLTQHNEYLTQQVATLRAENQALKEMAAIVR